MAVDTPLNINLMNLCLEILDNEHDLDRAKGETNPLYIYCYKHITDVTLQGIFMSKTYSYDKRLISINPKQILINMKDIVRQRHGSFTPAGSSNIAITYEYQESIISHGKTFDNLRTLISDRGKLIGQCIVETYRSVGGEPINQRDKMVDVYRSALTTQFDNPCSWKNPNVNLNNASVIGHAGTLDLERIYDNYFPKAASVFVYGSELKNVDAVVGTIIGLIRANINSINSTSVVPFVEVEFVQISIELHSFITFINDKIDVSKLYLLHIFKNFTQQAASGKEGGGTQYSFSLQMGQVELNEVSMELYGYNKRGSNILCRPQTPPTINGKMLFSENIPPHMRNCHISYGKLCGDGVTIFATKKANFDDRSPYNAVISIDEFCCLRAVYAGIIVAYQQKPSAMAGTGLGILSTTRNHGIYQVGNVTLDAAEAAEAAEAAALDTAAIELILNIANIFKNNDSLSIDEFVQIVGDKGGIILEIYKYNINGSDPATYEDMIKEIKSNFDNSLDINNMVDFCVNYNNILTNIKNITTISGRSRTATNQIERNMDDLFGGLGTLETLIQTYLNDDEYYTESRRHIVYIMITQLFTKPGFISDIPGFIGKLFTIDSPPNRDATDKYREFMTSLGTSGKNITPSNYKSIYDNLLAVYEVFNEYNCDDHLANGKITEAQCKYKHMLRQRLVIFKYIYRAYITCTKMIFKNDAGSPVKASTDKDPWTDIYNYRESFADKFNDAYNAMLKDTGSSISTPGKSPLKDASTGASAGEDADTTTEGEYEDQLGEVAIDDTFTYNSDETGTSCSDDAGNGKPGEGVCGKRESETMQKYDILKIDEKNENPQKRIGVISKISSKLPSSVATSYSPEDQQNIGWIAWLSNRFNANRRGGSPTRKRKRSKIPRRTIRRHAPRRGQKRTIRRRRRNNKRTQKRRK